MIDESKRLQGILTRHDLLKRVVLAEKDLSVAISEVMTSDIKTLEASDTVEMAGHLMMQASIRHLPIVKDAQVVGLISERDLFSFQRFSVSNISAAIHGAKNIQALVRAAEHIRQYSKNLLSQCVTGNRLTSLVSYLNDLLTSRLITMTATEFNIEADQFCWLALGSEGREEQTISTDQDNALFWQMAFLMLRCSIIYTLPVRLMKGWINAAFRCAKATSWPATPNIAAGKLTGSNAALAGLKRAHPKTYWTPAYFSISGP